MIALGLLVFAFLLWRTWRRTDSSFSVPHETFWEPTDDGFLHDHRDEDSPVLDDDSSRH